MLKVLGRVTSINVRKVLWALDEMGLSYSREDWGLPIRDPKVPEFLALNPNGQVPVFIEGEFVLWESNAILIYLAEREGALLPQQLEQRALALQWLTWQATELNPPWGYAVNALIRKTAGYDDPAKVAESIARWTAKMDVLESQLVRAGTGYVSGGFSIADIALGLSVHRWRSIPAEKKELPAVADYYELLMSREAGGTVDEPGDAVRVERVAAIDPIVDVKAVLAGSEKLTALGAYIVHDIRHDFLES